MNFSELNLDARLMQAVNNAGYETPTPIQAEAIPLVLSGADLIGTAQTGTGKTAAFVLPMLQRLLQTTDSRQPTQEGERDANRPTKTAQRKSHRALIITPTRELAEQINDTIKVLAKHTNIRSATIYGGVGPMDQERALRAGVEILVACPGRLLDHIDTGMCKLNGIEMLVLDEADRMFDMGFLPSVRRILGIVSPTRQTLLFSATFPREVEDLASGTLRNPKRVSIGRAQPAATVTHAIYPVPGHLKKKMLIKLLKDTDAFSMLVFTRTKHRAEALSKQLIKEGFKTTSLHSDRSQNQRQAALNGFKTGKFQVMVATDIAARGLDVETVSHVINYDIPDTVDAYIHRIGRTGRAEHEGDAFTLVTPEDNGMVRDIERALGQKLDRKTLDGFDYKEATAPRETQDQGAPPQPQRQSQSRDQREQRYDQRSSVRNGFSRDGQRDSRNDGNRAPRREPRANPQNNTQRPAQTAQPQTEDLNAQLERLHDRTSGDAKREQVSNNMRRPLRKPGTGGGTHSVMRTGSGNSGASSRSRTERTYMNRSERKSFG